MIQPAWKAQSGLVEDAPPSLHAFSDTASSKPPESPWDDAADVESLYEAADLRAAEDDAGGESAEAIAVKMRVTAELLATPKPLLFYALSGTEVVARQDFDGQGPGDWVSCRANEVMMLLYAVDDMVYVARHCSKDCSEGFVPASLVKHAGYHEFFVRLQASTVAPKKRLGLVWADAKGYLPGVVVVDVKPGSLLDDWNTTCRETFPRDQVLAGDVITWAQNRRDTEGIREALRAFRGCSTHPDGGVDPHGAAREGRMRLRISRMGSFLDNSCNLVAHSPASVAQLVGHRNRKAPSAQPPPPPASGGGSVASSSTGVAASWHAAPGQGQPPPDPWMTQDPWAASRPPHAGLPPSAPPPPPAGWGEVAGRAGEAPDEWTTPLDCPEAAASEASHVSLPPPPPRPQGVPSQPAMRSDESGEGGAARRMLMKSGVIAPR